MCKKKSEIKKESRLFDLTMGANDSAEVCELVGIFMLYQLSLKATQVYAEKTAYQYLRI